MTFEMCSGGTLLPEKFIGENGTFCSENLDREGDSGGVPGDWKFLQSLARGVYREEFVFRAGRGRKLDFRFAARGEEGQFSPGLQPGCLCIAELHLVGQRIGQVQQQQPAGFGQRFAVDRHHRENTAADLIIHGEEVSLVAILFRQDQHFAARGDRFEAFPLPVQ